MGENSVKNPPRSATEIFEECCPFYLSIGMSYDEFWHGNADLPRYYRKAYKLRQEKVNQDAWLNGLYVYDALTSAMSHLSSNKSHHKAYAEKPYSFDSKKNAEEKVIEEQAKAEMWMKSWAAATQKMFKQE